MKRRTNYTLTNEERAVLIGGILGDEILVRRGNSYRYRVQHSDKEAEYVHWKREKLANVCRNTQPPQTRPKRGTPHNVVEFYTDSGDYLKEIHELLYVNVGEKYKKRITPEVIERLPVDSLVVAVWYLDDGSIRNDCYAGKIASQNFTKEENELLCEYLRKFNFNIAGHVVQHTDESGQWYITIPAQTFGKLIDLIEPIVREIPSMVYKLNELRRTP